MPNLEWEVAHDIQSPAGTIHLNQTDVYTGRRYQIKPDGYKIVPSLRVATDNLSQSDGAVLHPRFKTGLVATMTVEYHVAANSDTVAYKPACGTDLREMHDELLLVLDSIRSLKGTQRLLWTPTGYSGQRMLDQIQCLAWPDPGRDGLDAEVTFSIETEFPYAIDSLQTDTPISDGGTATITCVATSDFSPVVKAHGPFTAFTIINNSVVDRFGNPLEVSYDGTRPGAVGVLTAHYAEIDFFRGTIFLDGDSTELIAAIDPGMTDFFPLIPGDNVIDVSGCDVDFLWNKAWS